MTPQNDADRKGWCLCLLYCKASSATLPQWMPGRASLCVRMGRGRLVKCRGLESIIFSASVQAAYQTGPVVPKSTVHFVLKGHCWVLTTRNKRRNIQINPRCGGGCLNYSMRLCFGLGSGISLVTLSRQSHVVLSYVRPIEKSGDKQTDDWAPVSFFLKHCTAFTHFALKRKANTGGTLEGVLSQYTEVASLISEYSYMHR